MQMLTVLIFHRTTLGFDFVGKQWDHHQRSHHSESMDNGTWKIASLAKISGRLLAGIFRLKLGFWGALATEILKREEKVESGFRSYTFLWQLQGSDIDRMWFPSLYALTPLLLSIYLATWRSWMNHQKPWQHQIKLINTLNEENYY